MVYIFRTGYVALVLDGKGLFALVAV
jgi:hypothetical protein